LAADFDSITDFERLLAAQVSVATTLVSATRRGRGGRLLDARPRQRRRPRARRDPQGRILHAARRATRSAA